MGDQRVRIGIIGFGFMGRTHARAIQTAKHDGFGVELGVVADSSLGSFDEVNEGIGNLETSGEALDFDGVDLVRTADEVISDESIDAVSVCTHTDSHVEIAIAALRGGKHVLVEKPIAIDPADVGLLAREANEHPGLVCMPAMCMRYWPAWAWMYDAIRERRYGRVRSAEFHRLGSRPTWAQDFYSNAARSGGALYDLHIHDTDFVVHCFGTPRSVMTSGDGLHLSSVYRFEGDNDPIHVIGQGAWDHQPGVGYRMRSTIVFEEATVDFDISRDDQLIVYRGDDAEVIDVGSLSGYDMEMRAFVDSILGKEIAHRVTMDDAHRVARVLACEGVSMREGRVVEIE